MVAKLYQRVEVLQILLFLPLRTKKKWCFWRIYCGLCLPWLTWVRIVWVGRLKSGESEYLESKFGSSFSERVVFFIALQIDVSRPGTQNIYTVPNQLWMNSELRVLRAIWLSEKIFTVFLAGRKWTLSLPIL